MNIALISLLIKIKFSSEPNIPKFKTVTKNMNIYIYISSQIKAPITHIYAIFFNYGGSVLCSLMMNNIQYYPF